MSTVTITSQGQITIPAAIRKAWGITGPTKLDIDFDTTLKRAVIQQPLTVDEATQRFRQLSKGQVQQVRPPTDTHTYYERERTKEIQERMKDWV